MIWHIMTFTLQPATAPPSVAESSVGANGHEQLDPRPGAATKISVAKSSRERRGVDTTNEGSATAKAEIPR
jgi:hypothetical protein